MGPRTTRSKQSRVSVKRDSEEVENAFDFCGDITYYLICLLSASERVPIYQSLLLVAPALHEGVMVLHVYQGSKSGLNRISQHFNFFNMCLSTVMLSSFRVIEPNPLSIYVLIHQQYVAQSS